MPKITANIPTHTIKLSKGSRSVPAHTAEFESDERGAWYALMAGNRYPVRQADVIDACRGATNWSQIKAEHFPMYGFHA
jgi:hypothetical protein